MYVVILLGLHGDLEHEVPAFAADARLTAFEAGQRLRGQLPAVVWRGPEVEPARHLGRAMHARGHEVVLLDAAQVPTGDALPRPSGFRLTDEALVARLPGGEASLRFDEVVCLVAAVQRRHSAHTEVTRERRLSLGRAVLTQGVSVHKTVEVSKTQSADEKEPVLYLFHRGGPAWLLAQSGCRYDGLGALVRPTALESFRVLGEVLRQRCPGAPWDERLRHARAGAQLGTAESSSDASTVDLLAHAVAARLTRPG